MKHRIWLPRMAVLVCLTTLVGTNLACFAGFVAAREPDEVIDIWPDRAPGESSRATGEALPRRADEDPPATRVRGITRPQLHVFKPSVATRNGAAVLIFPGGAYNYVVTDKEGSEAADWLNGLGVTAFVVHAHNDSATPPASVLMYVALKRHRVNAELHIYATGGHGYGMRPVAKSNVDTWPSRAADWLRQQELAGQQGPVKTESP